MYQAPIFSILWVGRTTSEHSFWVHVLYFKKQPISPPCCLAFYTEYNIHERDQINSPREQHPVCTEQLLNGSPIHPPQACASNLFWGHHLRECGSNGTITSLWFPTSLLTLSVCDNCQGDFRDMLSLLGTGLWTLRCTSQRSLNACHIMLPLWCGCSAFKLVSRTAFSCFKLAESPSWLADFMPCWGGALWLADSPHPDLLCHLCMPRGLLCGDTMTCWMDASWLAKLQLAQVPLAESCLCNLPSCDFVTHPPPYPLQHAWLLAVDCALDCGRALSLLSMILRICQEAREVFSDWCQSAEGRK